MSGWVGTGSPTDRRACPPLPETALLRIDMAALLAREASEDRLAALPDDLLCGCRSICARRATPSRSRDERARARRSRRRVRARRASIYRWCADDPRGGAADGVVARGGARAFGARLARSHELSNGGARSTSSAARGSCTPPCARRAARRRRRRGRAGGAPELRARRPVGDGRRRGRALRRGRRRRRGRRARRRDRRPRARRGRSTRTTAASTRTTALQVRVCARV